MLQISTQEEVDDDDAQALLVYQDGEWGYLVDIGYASATADAAVL